MLRLCCCCAEKATLPPWIGTSSIQVWPAGTVSFWPFLVVSLILAVGALPLCQVAATIRPPWNIRAFPEPLSSVSGTW